MSRKSIVALLAIAAMACLYRRRPARVGFGGYRGVAAASVRPGSAWAAPDSVRRPSAAVTGRGGRARASRWHLCRQCWRAGYHPGYRPWRRFPVAAAAVVGAGLAYGAYPYGYYDDGYYGDAYYGNGYKQRLLQQRVLSALRLRRQLRLQRGRLLRATAAATLSSDAFDALWWVAAAGAGLQLTGLQLFCRAGRRHQRNVIGTAGVVALRPSAFWRSRCTLLAPCGSMLTMLTAPALTFVFLGVVIGLAPPLSGHSGRSNRSPNRSVAAIVSVEIATAVRRRDRYSQTGR